MAKDPYKYFRIEARELLEGLAQGTLQLEKSGDAELFARLLRLAHTLKGAARVVRQPAIAELAHAVEAVLGRARDAGGKLAPAESNEVLRRVDEASARVSALDAPPESRPVPQPAGAGFARPSEPPVETLRVEVQELDALLRNIGEAGVQLASTERELASAGRARDLAALLVNHLAPKPGESGARAHVLAEELLATVERLQRGLALGAERVGAELSGIRESADRLRLVPARVIFGALERAVHDAAQALGKQVELAATGGEIRLDTSVLGQLRDALAHVVRNAVAHGIERESERKIAGKPPVGKIQLQVLRRGARVSFVVRDDGGGIDLEVLRRALVSRGRVEAATASTLGEAQLLSLLLNGGVSTQSQVTELAGRGIGLDVARATAATLAGELELRNAPGRGLEVELRVPISLASLPGLLVESAGMVAAIPLEAVRETLRLARDEVAFSGGAESIVREGKVLPFLPLERTLRRGSAGSRGRRGWSAVVVEANGVRAALGVDRLLGTANVVMRALPEMIAADPVVSGASLDAEGNPQLVLEPEGLVAAATDPRARVADSVAPSRLPILVIDDSLTTRMLEQSILESAGYTVQTATSAEEGMEKARAQEFGLFIVDVEMPGMDGFEFVTRTRQDARLRAVPAILVTSRNAPEDKLRGERAGASAYVVKGEFDQSVLLEHIRRLVG